MENTTDTGFSFDLPKGSSSIIKVIGVGGGGNNALKHMYEKGIKGVDFVICNTDAHTLDNNPISNKIQLGVTTTEGLGAGADPEVGEKAALESMEEIKAALGNQTKMVFITAGMGGGTGTGAAPVIAKIAKEMGILTVAIVTVPFSYEGKRRLEQAEAGLEKLRANCDSLIVVNNDKLRQLYGDLGFKAGFAKADEVLANAAKGMAEVITKHFVVNIDFRDAKSVLQNSGTALMSEGVASGENKAQEAIKKALDSPLLNDNKITGAKKVLLLIRSGEEEATMDEIGMINDYIQQESGHTADIICGIGIEEELGEAISVLVIATGFSPEDQKYSGPTETIVYKLDEKTERFHQPTIDNSFTISNAEEKTTSSDTPTTEPEKFRLEDDFPLNLKSNQISETTTFRNEQEEIQEMKFFEVEETVHQEKEMIFTKKQEVYREPDLFSFQEDLEVQSFSFETEEPVKNETPNLFQQNEVSSFQSFEKPSEPIVEKPSFEIKTEEPTVVQQKTEQPILIQEEIKPAVQIIQEPVVEQKVEEEFIIVEKKTEIDPKILERRNKLKEFNSRYHVEEGNNDFENIPAFKRKNLNINLEAPSSQKITSFFSEDAEGRMQLKENKFLNKDVD